MNSIGKALFEAIHKGKWLSIVYKNQSEQITKYWIAVKTLSPQNGQMQVDGLHLGRLTVQELHIRVERILSAEVIEGSWCKINEILVQDVTENPRKYEALFGNTANLRVLEYLTDCHKLDSTPYKTEYSLISQLDQDRFQDGTLALNGAICGDRAEFSDPHRVPIGPKKTPDPAAGDEFAQRPYRPRIVCAGLSALRTGY